MWFFFFNDTATTEIYTLSLHDALPIYLTDLEKMAARHPWLAVIPVVSGEPGFPGERGMLHEVLARSGNWRGHDVYASGPTPMVEATVTQLMALGVPRSHIRLEDFGWSEP